MSNQVVDDALLVPQILEYMERAKLYTYFLVQQGIREQLGGRHLTQQERKNITLAIQQKSVMIADELYFNASPDESMINNGILMITAYTSDYSIGQLCESVNREYATRHGYQFRSDVMSYEDMMEVCSPRSHCTWYKVHMINRIMEQADYLSEQGISYLCWIDADAMVVNPAISLDNFIASSKGRDLIIAEDMNPGCLVNAGVMLIKISEWSKVLWANVWQSLSSQKYFHVYYYEQSALTRCLKGCAEGLELFAPFHSYTGGMEEKFTPHVYVVNHMKLNTNRGWDKKRKKKIKDKDKALPPPTPSTVFSAPSALAPSPPPVSSRSQSTTKSRELRCSKGEDQATCDKYQKNNPSDPLPLFIFHAAGIGNKLQAIIDMLILYKVDGWQAYYDVPGGSGEDSAIPNEGQDVGSDDQVEDINESSSSLGGSKSTSDLVRQAASGELQWALFRGKKGIRPSPQRVDARAAAVASGSSVGVNK